MAIVKKPKRMSTDTVKPDPLAFIQGAQHQAEPVESPEPQPARRKRKEPVIIRFDDHTLARVDREASKRGLSRSALVRMLVIESLSD